MAFISNLAKGFVRSAVNQVGRDGGKVISNQVYGNSHSSPLNMVSNNATPENVTIDTTGLFEDKEYIWVKIFWGIIISFIIPIIGGLIIIYRGFVNYNKKTVKLYRLERQAVYAADRRYNTGQRFEGHREVKVPVIAEINDEQKQRARIKSYGYFIVGIGSLLFYAFVKLK